MPSPITARPLRLVGLALLVLGLAMLVFMVTVEDEPGVLPLALVGLGAGLLVWSRRR